MDSRLRGNDGGENILYLVPKFISARKTELSHGRAEINFGTRKSIGNLAYLRELNLAENQLSELPESIGNLANLQKLILRDNPIRKLPPNLAHLEEITIW